MVDWVATMVWMEGMDMLKMEEQSLLTTVVLANHNVFMAHVKGCAFWWGWTSWGIQLQREKELGSAGTGECMDAHNVVYVQTYD